MKENIINDTTNNKDILRILNKNKELKYINDYGIKEDKLYQNYNINTKRQKIIFECKRILKFITENDLEKKYYSFRYYTKNVFIIMSSEKMLTDEEIENEILIDLIKIELELGMNCVLYREISELSNDILNELKNANMNKRNLR